MRRMARNETREDLQMSDIGEGYSVIQCWICPKCNDDHAQNRPCKTLDLWEAEAKGSHGDQIIQTILAIHDRRILALIELVRKKDEALKFYGVFESWDADKFICMSSAGRNDLDETSYSRFTPGKKAREAIALTEELK